MIRKFTLILLLLLTIHNFSLKAENDSSQKTPIQIVQNPLASIKDRKKAINELKISKDDEAISVLIEIVRDPKEPIGLRAYVMQRLAQIDDQWVASDLKKLLQDASLDPESKMLVLYTLWKKDPKGMKEPLISLAQNGNETVEMRVAALNYLRLNQGKWPTRFWESLFLGKNNPAPVRIQALNGMKELGLLTESETVLIPIIENSSEPFELRKSVILTAVPIIPFEVLEKSLISILLKSENSIEMRRFALDSLALKPDRALLPKLKEIFLSEKDPVLRSDLKTYIDTVAKS